MARQRRHPGRTAARGRGRPRVLRLRQGLLAREAVARHVLAQLLRGDVARAAARRSCRAPEATPPTPGSPRARARSVCAPRRVSESRARRATLSTVSLVDPRHRRLLYTAAGAHVSPGDDDGLVPALRIDASRAACRSSARAAAASGSGGPPRSHHRTILSGRSGKAQEATGEETGQEETERGHHARDTGGFTHPPDPPRRTPRGVGRPGAARLRDGVRRDDASGAHRTEGVLPTDARSPAVSEGRCSTRWSRAGSASWPRPSTRRSGSRSWDRRCFPARARPPGARGGARLARELGRPRGAGRVRRDLGRRSGSSSPRASCT